MTGIWGTRVGERHRPASADVILAVGTTFGEADCSSWNPNYTFAIPPTRLIQIDIDPQEIGKIYPVEVGLVGDAKATLRELAAQSSRGAHRAGQRGAQRADLDDAEGGVAAGALGRAAQRRQADSSGAAAERDLARGAEGHDVRHRRRLEQERRGPAAA